MRQIFKKGIYGSPTDSIVIDIGAWVGDSSIYFARLRNHVVAIEPIEMHARYIHLNARLSGLEDRIKVINAAYHFTTDKLNRIDLRGPATKVPSGLNNINYVKLSEIISDVGKAYIKADCEGCEYDLINELIPQYTDTVYGIAMEIHKDAGNHLKLLSKLTKYYTAEKVTEDDYVMVVQLSKKT
ncbi:MAG: FkbM family methyltransferase [Sulfolobales archaeon]|nr:FkbM family methyltransferase [Sulfolobales archaeon]